MGEGKQCSSLFILPGRPHPDLPSASTGHTQAGAGQPQAGIMLTHLSGQVERMSPPHAELIYLLYKDLPRIRQANYGDTE